MLILSYKKCRQNIGRRNTNVYVNLTMTKNILNNIEVTTVKTVDEVLKTALTKDLKPVEWIEVENLPKSKSSEKTAPGSTH